jgi:hypothetical protein
MSDDLGDRLSAADELVKRGRYDEATREFEWLWDNMQRIEPSLSCVRVSVMAKSIKELVGKHPPARARFAEIRDRSARRDWIVLNDVLSEPEKTLAWFDGVKDGEDRASVLDSVASRLIPLLKSHGRLRDIGRIYRDPVAELRRLHSAFQPPSHIADDPCSEPDPRLGPELQSLMQQVLQEIFEHLPKEVVEEAALMVASLLAAGRTADADAVEQEARRLDPSEAMRAALQKARGRLH